jgi:4-amino-4-deoxy-L-arabinose transferase-like glycosyltransferase
MRRRNIIILLFIFSLVVNLFAMVSSSVIWWDEGIYSGLGWGLSGDLFNYSFKGFGDFTSDGSTEAGFRAPLLPFVLSLVYAVFGNSQLIPRLVVPVFSAIGVIGLYLLAEKMFNSKIALYSSLLMTSIPMYMYYSGKILTDTFSVCFMIFAGLFFWMGFIENKNIFKILCGAFCGLSILARFTGVLLPIIFGVYYLLSKKNLNFLKDKWFYGAVIVFLLVLAPWLFYSWQTYGDILGFFWHAQTASTYWGGLQSWDYLFWYFPVMFSFGLLLFGAGLVFSLKKFDNKKGFLLLWVLVFLLFTTFLMQHKEDRFLMPIVPMLAIMGGYSITKLDKRIFVGILILTLLSGGVGLYNQLGSYSDSHLCYLESLEFIKSLEGEIVFTQNSPVTYFYTHKKTFYPVDNKFITNTLNGQIGYLISSDYEGEYDYPGGKEIFNCKNKTFVFEIN